MVPGVPSRRLPIPPDTHIEHFHDTSVDFQAGDSGWFMWYLLAGGIMLPIVLKIGIAYLLKYRRKRKQSLKRGRQSRHRE